MITYRETTVQTYIRLSINYSAKVINDQYFEWKQQTIAMGTIDALTSVSQNLQNNDQLSSLFSSRCPLVIQTTKVHESKGRRNIIKSD